MIVRVFPWFHLGVRPWLGVAITAVVLAGCSGGPDPAVRVSPTGDVDLWRTDRDEPYPFVTPIPPVAPTPLDGRYVRALTPAEGAPPRVPCRRCPPYFLNSGRAVMTFDRGRFHLEHPAAALTARAHYVVDGDRIVFLNDAACPDTRGIYRWSREGGVLTLEVIEDDCAFDLLRARYLSAAPWTSEG